MRPVTRCLALLAALGSASVADAAPRCIGPEAATGASRAVVVDDVPLVHTTQFLPLEADGRLVAPGDAAKQCDHILSALDRVLAESRSSLDRAVKLNVSATSNAAVADVQRTLARRFSGTHKPAVGYVVGVLPHPRALVAIDAVAPTEAPTAAVTQRGQGEQATAAVLPAGAKVYIAGQAEKADDLATATRKTLESLSKTLRFLGLDDTHTVQLKAFYTPADRADVVRREVAKFYGGTAPPLVLVEWKSSLPIEIELVAWAGKARPGEPVEYLTPPGMTASPVYSRVARVNQGPLIFVSGLHGKSEADAATEVADLFDQLGDLLKQTGSDFRHLVKATYYVSTDATSGKLNELRPRWYDPKRPPSASKAMTVGVGRAGRAITLDMIAVPSR